MRRLLAKVATGSYNYRMAYLKTVGIKELKNNLSAYLREVRAGATVLVSDRNSVVAELHEPFGRPDMHGARHPLLLAWAQSGIVSIPEREKQPLEVPCVHLRDGVSRELLDRDRKEPEE